MSGSAGRRGVGAIVACAAAVFLFPVSARVLAQEPAVIKACVGPDGVFRAPGASGGCSGAQQSLTWNAIGPAGPEGPAGPIGPEGPAGRDGRDATGPVPPAAVVSLQMTIEGMNGDAPTPILNFALGAANPGTTSGGGGSAGSVTFQDLAVTKMLDGMSIALMSAAATGTHLKHVTIESFPVGETTPLATYVFQDVLVSAVALGSSINAMTESVTFNFAKIVSDITLMGTTFHSCYDIKANKQC